MRQLELIFHHYANNDPDTRRKDLLAKHKTINKSASSNLVSRYKRPVKPLSASNKMNNSGLPSVHLKLPRHQ